MWSEKGTIRGTLAPILDAYGITFRVMHGYGSATAIKQVAEETAESTKPLTALYAGDWDPSGLHMSEVDLPNRIREYGGTVNLVRLALNDEDTRSGLPSFPASTKKGDARKKGDSRYNWFVEHELRRLGISGTPKQIARLQCWELDALSPVILRRRVEDAIRARLDVDAWRRAEIVEQAERESLTTILNAWPGISGQASKYSLEDRA